MRLTRNGGGSGLSFLDAYAKFELIYYNFYEYKGGVVMKKDNDQNSSEHSVFSEIRRAAALKKDDESNKVAVQKACDAIAGRRGKEEHFELAKKYLLDNKEAIIEKIEGAEKYYEDPNQMEGDRLAHNFVLAFMKLQSKKKSSLTVTTVGEAAAAASRSDDNLMTQINESTFEVSNKNGDKLYSVERQQDKTIYQPKADSKEAYEAVAERISKYDRKLTIKVEGGTEEQRLEIIQALKDKNPNIKLDQKTQDFFDEHQPSSPKP